MHNRYFGFEINARVEETEKSGGSVKCSGTAINGSVGRYKRSEGYQILANGRPMMDRCRLVQPGFAATVAAVVAGQIHQGWRDGFEASKGVGAERWKNTSDRTWLEANAGEAYCKDGQVNINIPNELLPADKAQENNDAAAMVVSALVLRLIRGYEFEDLDVASIAAEVHEAWCQRRVMQDDDWWVADLSQPYEELPVEQQEKDDAQVALAVAALQAALA